MLPAMTYAMQLYMVCSSCHNRGFPKPTHFWGVPLIVLNFRYDLVLIRKRLS